MRSCTLKMPAEKYYTEKEDSHCMWVDEDEKSQLNLACERKRKNRFLLSGFVGLSSNGRTFFFSVLYK